MQLVKRNLTKIDLLEKFLPSLSNSVFHFTYSKNWPLILEKEKILSNTNGKYGYGSVHSQKSMGCYLGAVCLFDLRNVNIDSLGEGSIYYDYFNRRVTEASPGYFLILSKAIYSKVIRLDNVDKKLQQEMMYIPDIESWHVGDLDLQNIETVYEISLK